MCRALKTELGVSMLPCAAPSVAHVPHPQTAASAARRPGQERVATWRAVLDCRASPALPWPPDCRPCRKSVRLGPGPWARALGPAMSPASIYVSCFLVCFDKEKMPLQNRSLAPQSRAAVSAPQSPRRSRAAVDGRSGLAAGEWGRLSGPASRVRVRVQRSSPRPAAASRLVSLRRSAAITARRRRWVDAERRGAGGFRGGSRSSVW